MIIMILIVAFAAQHIMQIHACLCMLYNIRTDSCVSPVHLGLFTTRASQPALQASSAYEVLNDELERKAYARFLSLAWITMCHGLLQAPDDTTCGHQRQLLNF